MRRGSLIFSQPVLFSAASGDAVRLKSTFHVSTVTSSPDTPLQETERKTAAMMMQLVNDFKIKFLVIF